jgi:hypothetical protein
MLNAGEACCRERCRDRNLPILPFLGFLSGEILDRAVLSLKDVGVLFDRVKKLAKLRGSLQSSASASIAPSSTSSIGSRSAKRSDVKHPTRLPEPINTMSGMVVDHQQHDPDHRKSVGAAHNRGLRADALADGDDRAVHRAGWIGVAVRHEIALEVGEPVSRRRFEQRDLRRDNRRMELLAMGEATKPAPRQSNRAWRPLSPPPLYRCLDKLLAHKQELFSFLRQRWQTLFQADFEILLYDLTSTYFACDPPETGKRRFGHSRDRTGRALKFDLRRPAGIVQE